MQLIRIILLLAFTLLAGPVVALERSTRFSIANMTCILCPITVKSAISRVPGVIAVEVDADLRQATVRYDDAQATAADIAAASTNAGYPAIEIQSP